jgi:hypothetical protein
LVAQQVAVMWFAWSAAVKPLEVAMQAALIVWVAAAVVLRQSFVQVVVLVWESALALMLAAQQVWLAVLAAVQVVVLAQVLTAAQR